QPHGRWPPLRRHRVRRGGAAGLMDHPGAGRRRPHDRGHADAEHPGRGRHGRCRGRRGLPRGGLSRRQRARARRAYNSPIYLPPEPVMRLSAEALTFDDVSLVPAHSTVLPRDVRLATRLTREIRLNMPLVSAAMDTVTEA